MIMRKFREAEYETKLKRVAVVQNNTFNNRWYKEENLVFYQKEDK